MSLASLVKELRQKTGAGILDAKKALEATEGNIEHAMDWLRENGIAKAAKKGDRVAAEGLTKIVENGDEALILELNAETDFVAKNQEFLDLLDTIANGILNSSAETLDDAMSVVIGDGTVDTLVTNGTATIGEKISLRRIRRLKKGQGEVFTTYSHMGGRISVIVRLKKEDQELGKGLAMHIASDNPEYLSKDDVPVDVVDKEREILTKEVINEGKPEKIAENIVNGRIRKFLEQVSLLEQPYVLDTSKTVAEVVKEADNEILDFVRYEVGEGIEKEETNFAEEVAAQANL